MKHLLINMEAFKSQRHSITFDSVIDALRKSGTILSEQATTEALKGIYEEGLIAGSTGVDQHEYWNKLKKEL